MLTSNWTKPTGQTPANFALTSGEPAGIGPDLCIQLAQRQRAQPLVVFADTNLLQQRAQQLGLALGIKTYQSGQLASCKAHELTVYPVPLHTPCTAGQLNPRNAHSVLSMLEHATKACLRGEFAALVTAPVQKSILYDAGIAFSGHTEFLAQLSGVDKVVMMLASPTLRVALVTTHLPLRQVADAITPQELQRTLEILHRSLQQQFGLKQPRILVAGLNPHAGEGGHLGREEIDVIEPVLNTLRNAGFQLTGPLPADTLFTEPYLAQADAVVAMYHDQGLPVLKHSGFGEAVNVTLGLPFIRTSVDHGTALSLAGSGQANTSSLEAAIRYASHMHAAKMRAAQSTEPL